MRKKCYYDAGYKCEACGKTLGPGECQAHELYTYNYVAGQAKFERCVCLCKQCHVQGIHSGRALTMYKKGNPLMTRQMLLDGAENLFRVLHEYNVAHPDEEPLRAYATFVDYARWPELHDDMMALIKKYDVKFYQANPAFLAKWGDWKLTIGNKSYPTPYKDKLAWEIAMAANDKQNHNVAIKEKPKTETDLAVEEILGLTE